MSSDYRKTPAVFTYTKEKGTQRFSLEVRVGAGDLVNTYTLKGFIQREIQFVILDGMDTDAMIPSPFTDSFQALLLRVASLYTGYPLRKFALAGDLGSTWFDDATILTNVGALNMPSVNATETLRLDKVASEIYEVTCNGMYAVMTHDPEEVEFREEWMDPTSGMMLNAVFEIPKMWTSNINASGMVVRDSQTEWVWNYSPSTEMLIIHVHDRANKKHSQWEVSRDLAIHFTGSDRENGTHYRSFINRQGGRQWHVTRKVVVQRSFVTELPAGTTKGVFKQIKYILQVLQDRATCKIGETTFTPNYLLWLPMTSLEEAWRGADGKLPVEPPAALREAYLRLVFHYDETLPNYNAPEGRGQAARTEEVLESMYALLTPRYVPGESRAGRFRKFWAELGIDLEKLLSMIRARLEGDKEANVFDVLSALAATDFRENLMFFKSGVMEKEKQEDENIGH